MCSQSRNREFLVLRIDAMLGRVLPLAVQQVAKVVQKRGRNQSVIAAFALDKPCSLQGVLQHGNRLAEIGFVASTGRQSQSIRLALAQRQTITLTLRRAANRPSTSHPGRTRLALVFLRKYALLHAPQALHFKMKTI
jgi:hypothetical protein